MKSSILVVIECLAYNHEPYIRECLEGIVMQRTSFDFVAIVHDDASTDGTPDIIYEFEKKYPDIIKPIYEIENQYSKHDGTLDNIVNKLMAAYNPKYVAICEGDDYWIDPYKLQKQVDFLEGHIDFSMCFHSAIIKNESCSKVITTCDSIQDKEYFTNDFFPGWVIPTASVVYRLDSVMTYPKLKHPEWIKYGDIVLFLKCSHTGRVWGMSKQMSVYRMTEGGAVLSQRNEKDLHVHMCKHYEALLLNFPKLDKTWINSYISTYYYTNFRKNNGINESLKSLYLAFIHSPKYVIRKLLKVRTQGTY